MLGTITSLTMSLDGNRSLRVFVQVSVSPVGEREWYSFNSQFILCCLSFRIIVNSPYIHHLLHLLIKVVAPVLGSVVILVTMLEFCLDSCCVLGFLRSLLLCFTEICQMFTFAICKWKCS